MRTWIPSDSYSSSLKHSFPRISIPPRATRRLSFVKIPFLPNALTISCIAPVLATFALSLLLFSLKSMKIISPLRLIPFVSLNMIWSRKIWLKFKILLSPFSIESLILPLVVLSIYFYSFSFLLHHYYFIISIFFYFIFLTFNIFYFFYFLFSELFFILLANIFGIYFVKMAG